MVLAKPGILLETFGKVAEVKSVGTVYENGYLYLCWDFDGRTVPIVRWPAYIPILSTRFLHLPGLQGHI